MSLLSKLAPAVLPGALFIFLYAHGIPRQDFESYTSRAEFVTQATVSGTNISTADQNFVVFKNLIGETGVYSYDERRLLRKNPRYPERMVYIHYSMTCSNNFDLLPLGQQNEYCDMLSTILQQQQDSPFVQIRGNQEQFSLLYDEGEKILSVRFQNGKGPIAAPLYLINGEYVPVVDPEYGAGSYFVAFSFLYFRSLLAMGLILGENNYFQIEDMSTEDMYRFTIGEFGVVQIPKEFSSTCHEDVYIDYAGMVIDFPDTDDEDTLRLLKNTHSVISSCIEDPHKAVAESWGTGILLLEEVIKTIDIKERDKNALFSCREKLRSLGGF